MIEDAIKFEKALGYDFNEKPKTSDKVDKLISEELRKK